MNTVATIMRKGVYNLVYTFLIDGIIAPNEVAYILV